MLKRSLVGLLCLLLCMCFESYGQKQYQWKEKTEDGYTYKYVTNDPMGARFYQLKNGLTVVLSVNKKEPRIQTLIGIRAGSNSDPADHTGLAHYLEHLLFKGTDKYGSLDWNKERAYIDRIDSLYTVYNQTTDANRRKVIYHMIDSVSGVAAKQAIANEYDNMMASLGAQGTNAHTAVEETVYEENIPSNALDRFLAVQAERFRYPVFRLFHTELEAVYEEKNRGLDNDGRKMYETLLNTLFPTHNYGQQSTIGTIDHLKNPSLKAIRDFYNKYYVPNNMALIMAGDFNPSYVIKKVDAAFSYMKSAPVKEYAPAPEKPIQAPIVKEVFGPDAESVNIAFRMPGALDTRSSVLLTVTSMVLSNGKAGLIDLNLNKQQKILGASAGVWGFKDYSVFLLGGKAKQDQSLEDVKKLLLEQLDLLKKGSFDESLVKAIVNNAKLSELQGLEDNGSRAESLMDAYIKHKGLQWTSDVAYLDEMSKVTKKQIIDFANQYLGENYVLIYKRKGEDKSIVKVDKPAITPVEVNRDARSPFLESMAKIPITPVEPQWLDYKKDIQQSKIGPADVLYVQNKENGLFRAYYRFEMGSWSDKRLGIAAQYLQFLGTDKASAEQISKAFYNIACNFSVSASSEETTISISGLQENFGEAVRLFESLITTCKADDAALVALKDRLRKSRADNKLNKSSIMRGMMQYAMYGEKNPFNFQLSDEELTAVTAKELTDLLHGLMGYKHSILYYGPESLATLTPLFQKAHALPTTFRDAPAPVKFTKVDQTANTVLFTDYDMVQVEVNWVRNTTAYDPANTARIMLFNSYFGGGMGTIVFQTIRESKALAYSTYATYASPDKKDGRYTAIAYVGSQADKIGEAVVSMNELLDDMPHTDKIFITARDGIKQDIETERINQDGIIFSYLAARKLGLDIDYRKEVYRAVDALTYADIAKFHDDNLRHKAYTYCVLASSKNVKEDDLKKFGAVKKLTLPEIFGY